MSEQEPWQHEMKKQYQSVQYRNEALYSTQRIFKHKLLWVNIKTGVLAFGVVVAIISSVGLTLFLNHEKLQTSNDAPSEEILKSKWMDRETIADTVAHELDSPEAWQDMDEIIEMEDEIWDMSVLDRTLPFPSVLIASLKS